MLKLRQINFKCQIRNSLIKSRKHVVYVWINHNEAHEKSTFWTRRLLVLVPEKEISFNLSRLKSPDIDKSLANLTTLIRHLKDPPLNEYSHKRTFTRINNLKLK